EVPAVARGIVDALIWASRRTDVRVRLREYFGPRDIDAIPPMNSEMLSAYIELYASMEPRWVEYIFTKVLRTILRSPEEYKYVHERYLRALLRAGLANWNISSIGALLASIDSEFASLPNISSEILIMMSLLAHRWDLNALVEKCLFAVFTRSSDIPELV